MKKQPVLGLTQDGTPHQWLSWEDAVTMMYKGLVAWTPSENETSYFGGVSRITGERSHIEVPSIIAVKGTFKKSNRVPALTNQNLFKRDLLLCGYCGKHFSEDRLTRDHIIPVSKGGKDIWSNVVAACKKCNNHKGSKTLDELGWQMLWVPYVPDRCETLILQNRKILYDQAKYVADFLPEHSRVPRYLKEHCGIEL